MSVHHVCSEKRALDDLELKLQTSPCEGNRNSKCAESSEKPDSVLKLLVIPKPSGLVSFIGVTYKSGVRSYRSTKN